MKPTSADSPKTDRRPAEVFAGTAQALAQLRPVAARLLADPGTVEDVLQQTLVNAWLFLERKGFVRSPGSWLYTLLLNEIRRSWRKNRRWRSLSEVQARQIPARPENLGEAEERARRLSCLRAALAGRRRDLGMQVLCLRLDGLSHARISQKVGRTPVACRVAALRARARLKELFDQSA